MASMEWYYTRAGAQHGPVDEAELGRLLRTGVVGPDEFVWHPDVGDEWVSVSTVSARFGVIRPRPAQAVTIESTRRHASRAPGTTPNRELMQMGRESMQTQWGLGAGVTALYWLIVSVISLVPEIGTLASWLISGPLALGYAIVFLHLARRESAEVGHLFEGFRFFAVALAAYFLMMIFVVLWMLLLIIPGLIAAYSYILTYYIIADEPSISPFEAIRRSKQLMHGHRWKCFCLQCRFLGWAVLCLFTMGIGFLWLVPYMQATLAHFYEDVRGAYAEAEAD